MLCLTTAGTKTRSWRHELLPGDDAAWRAFLGATWIERTVHELAVEIEERRGWLEMPLHDLLALVEAGETGTEA